MNIILLVSDLPELQEIMVSLLGSGDTTVKRITANQLKSDPCDLVVVEFTEQMMKEERYKLIFDVKSRIKSPVLAVIEGGGIRERLNILNFGADNYIERKNMEKELSRKTEQLLRQNKFARLVENKKYR